ncbi:MAG: ABC transporter ATP-binding protein [Gaiellales bacterium]
MTAAEAANGPLLQVSDLFVYFGPRHRPIRAVDGVSFEIYPGETLGLVGESGCGKSTTARALISLARATMGSVLLNGRQILGLSHRKMNKVRRQVQIVFQDPYASLDPRMTVGDILGEPIDIHRIARGRRKKLRIVELMLQVGLDPRFLNRYPHEFSGGQRQRIGIARALALDPMLLLLDEPVSALDVSIQAQVLNLLKDLRAERGLAYLFIAHDLAVVRHLCDRVAVMYLGQIVEIGSREDIFERPLHPYTRALLSAVPVPDPGVEAEREQIVLKGDPPSPDREPIGCSFAGRCPIAKKHCLKDEPSLQGAEHRVACWEV